MLSKIETVRKNNNKFVVYQHCLMSAEAPHILVDEEEIKKEFKKSKAWFAQYVTEFDLRETTSRWYCLKDEEYDISKFKSKMRYEINKGRKNFFVKLIDPNDYKQKIFDIDKIKFAEYPSKYRPSLASNCDEHLSRQTNEGGEWFGLFTLNEDELVGYVIVLEKGNYVNLKVMAVLPSTFKKNSSAALIDGVLRHYQEQEKKFYICDGARNIRHITNFQDYLVSTFDFRFAYCRTKLIYKWWCKMLIIILRPFKNILLKSNLPMLYNIGCILRLDDYAKQSQK